VSAAPMVVGEPVAGTQVIGMDRGDLPAMKAGAVRGDRLRMICEEVIVGEVQQKVFIILLLFEDFLNSRTALFLGLRSLGQFLVIKSGILMISVLLMFDFL
jgi:hypothetical protein